MTPREKLIRAVLDLPESEVEGALQYVASRARDPLSVRLDNSPLEDEEISAEEEAAAAEGRADIAAGRTVSLEELKREFDLR